MISGSAGPGKTTNYANRFGPMTTLSFLQIDEKEIIGSRDGMVPMASSARSEELAKTIAQSTFSRKFNEGCQVLQDRLVARGMTPLFPRQLAGPLADPIVGSHRGTEEGFKLLKRVDIESIRLDYLAKKAGSRLMFAAYTKALGEASDVSRYLTIDGYCAIVADAFMADPGKMVVWHMMGKGYNPYTPERALKVGIPGLVTVAGAAQLFTIKNNPQWRVNLGDLLTVKAAASFGPAVLDALGVLYESDQLPTLVKVLDTAAQSLKGELDTAAISKVRRSLADLEVEPLHGDEQKDPNPHFNVRF